MNTLATIINDICREQFQFDGSLQLTRPEEQHGDFATNVAMQLAGKLGKNPREIAELLADAIRERCGNDIKEVTIAGPGFINIRLTDQALLEQVSIEPVSEVMRDKTVLVEYSDPNVMKPLHAGHLYTTLVGDTISRLIERSGATVVRLNYGGDVGLHVGKSMWAIIKELGSEDVSGLNKIPEGDRPNWLGQKYAQGHMAYEDDEQSKSEIIATNKRVYAVHTENDHESDFAKIYWTCREWSYEYFKVLYTQLQVKPFDRFIPESEVTPLGINTVREQLAKGVYTNSDGAVVFEGEKYGLHTRVFINSEGLPTYEAKDVGLILTKWRDYHYDSSIVITANEQDQYYKVMLKSVEQFAPELTAKSVHITHGVVKLQGGVKMSSRKGTVITAIEIIEAARKAANEASPGTGDSTVLAAIKYAFAKNKVGGDIAYDPKESIALEGNSGPYLQYAHARARSILQKAGAAPVAVPTQLEADERTLVRMLGTYEETIHKAIDELLPHHICTYLYELAQQFNRFYEKNRVIDDPRQAERLQLVTWYADVLRDGLTLLGIEAIDRM